MSAQRLVPRLLQLAALAGAVSFAMCGVKGPPRPPLGTEDQYGKREGQLPAGCESLEPPATIPVGKTTEEICDACADLREKRRRCGVKEPLGARCKALCERGDWSRDLDPGQGGGR